MSRPYIRSSDGAAMVEIAARQYVNRKIFRPRQRVDDDHQLGKTVVASAEASAERAEAEDTVDLSERSVRLRRPFSFAGPLNRWPRTGDLYPLMHEATHRAKDMLGLVLVIARQIAASHPEDFIGRFTEHVQALAANQDLLGRNEWRGADLEDLVRAQLAHFADLVGSRIAVHGGKLRLNAAAAQAVGLALHELATNAGKFGALATDAGHIEIGWRSEGDVFTMDWTEREGPPVRLPKRRGFGSTLIESMVKRAIEGKVQLDYAPSGLVWHLTCPAANALESAADRESIDDDCSARAGEANSERWMCQGQAWS